MNEETAEKQGKNKAVDAIRPYMWKKGQSGNVLGRPKGKTMKEWAREYLERMNDEERDEFMEGIPKEVIWKMSEGNPKQEVDGEIKAVINVVVPEAVAKSFNINATSPTTGESDSR